MDRAPDAAKAACARKLVPGNGLSGDRGNGVLELLHRESVYEVYLSY